MVDTAKPGMHPPRLNIEVVKNRIQANRKALAFLERTQDSQPFIDVAQRLVYLKGRDWHDYKFSSAMFEDCRHLSPELRNRFWRLRFPGFMEANSPSTL